MGSIPTFSEITSILPLLKSIILQKHSFHIVNRSQLPFLAAGFAMLTTWSLALLFHQTSNLLKSDTLIFHTATIFLNCVILAWFFMIVYEAGRGFHTALVQKGLKLGFWLFLISEGMLFFSFFWAYFHYSLNPSIVLGHQWPAEIGIQQIDPYQIPLLNTILLLSSGVTATIAHRVILTTDFNINKIRKNKFNIALMSTIILGYIFLSCQAIEYAFGLNQSWLSNVYWSIFFLLTGFHGFHVIVGTLFLQFNLVRVAFFENLRYVLLFLRRNSILWNPIIIFLTCFYRMINSLKFHLELIHDSVLTLFSRAQKIGWTLTTVRKIEPVTQTYKKTINLVSNFNYFVLQNRWALQKFSLQSNQHLGFEAALYYWHFVDAVWILLYLVVYIWGS